MLTGRLDLDDMGRAHVGHKLSAADAYRGGQVEHTVAGKQFFMEMHLVHQDAQGNLPVVFQPTRFTPVKTNIPPEHPGTGGGFC